MNHSITPAQIAYSGDTLTLEGGYTARVCTERDDNMGEPWTEHEGHGIVSEWTFRDKAAGELILCSDRSSKRFYDLEQTMRIARKDGWGLGAKDLAALTTRLGRKPTKGQIVQTAVMQDFERLRGWCADEWEWVGVIVTLFDPQGNEVGRESVWGVEDDTDYWKELAAEYVNSLMENEIKEVAERAHWEARDTVTAA